MSRSAITLFLCFKNNENVSSIPENIAINTFSVLIIKLCVIRNYEIQYIGKESDWQLTANMEIFERGCTFNSIHTKCFLHFTVRLYF